MAGNQSTKFKYRKDRPREEILKRHKIRGRLGENDTETEFSFDFT